MIHYELLQETSRQRSPQLSPYLALYWQHGRAISALEETFIINFTNLFHQLSKPSYGRDIEIINLYLNRAPTYRLCVPECSHTFLQLPASLFVSLWHLKTPRRLGVVSPLQYWTLWCVRNMNNVDEMESSTIHFIHFKIMSWWYEINIFYWSV